MLWILAYCQYIIVSIFSHFVDFFVVIVVDDDFLCCTKVFKLNEVLYVYFFLYFYFRK